MPVPMILHIFFCYVPVFFSVSFRFFGQTCRSACSCTLQAACGSGEEERGVWRHARQRFVPRHAAS